VSLRRCLPVLGRLLVVTIGLAALGDDCDGDILRDPTFRDWCGAELCAWTRDDGEIASVPSWNENDRAVAFVSPLTQISQKTFESAATCILFTSVADIDVTAQMSLLVDFNSDGTVDYEAPLAATFWQRVETLITAPEAYQGITFLLRKDGTGTAALAEMRVQSTSGCTGAAVMIKPGSLALGVRCTDSVACGSGLVCNQAAGDPRCAECSDDRPCPNAGVCEARGASLPAQCDPGERAGGTGAPCLADDDCQSGSCAGAAAVPLADDAGACDLGGAFAPADPVNCEGYAARGGRCQ